MTFRPYHRIQLDGGPRDGLTLPDVMDDVIRSDHEVRLPGMYVRTDELAHDQKTTIYRWAADPDPEYRDDWSPE